MTRIRPDLTNRTYVCCPEAGIMASFLDYFLKSVILERDQLDGWYHCNREVVDLTRVFPLSKFF